MLLLSDFRFNSNGGVVSTMFTIRTMLAGTFPARSAGA